MGIIFVIGLVFVILDSNKVRIDGFWVKGEGNKSVDGGGFGNYSEGPRLSCREHKHSINVWVDFMQVHVTYLLILKLYQPLLINHDLISLILAPVK